MPSVFTDAVGNHDLTVTVPADWTIDTAVMPNGDNAAYGDGTIAPTYNLNGSDFDLFDGNYWTIEVWVKVTASLGTARYIACNGPNGTTGSPYQQWVLYVASAGHLVFTAITAASGTYMNAQSSSSIINSQWRHGVWHIKAGVSPVMYLDNSTSGTTLSGPTGTVLTPTVAYRLFLGTDSSGGGDTNTNMTIAKLAFYKDASAFLSSGRINAHYLAMTT